MGLLIKFSNTKLIRNILFVSSFILLLVLIFSLVPGVHFPVAVIASGSMSPTLDEGDVVAWVPVDMEDVGIGDVVVFKSYVGWSDERLVAHRVTEIVVDDDVLMLGTKGDASELDDQDMVGISEPYVRSDHLLGRVVSVDGQPLKVPLVGYMGVWLNNSGVSVWLLFSLLLSVLLVFVVYNKKPQISII